jgi:hypothetical protein
MALTSVAAPIWNEIAKTQTLKTEWARKAFKLNNEQMAALEDREYLALKKKVGQEVALALSIVKPLLLENLAITNYILDGHQELRSALPEIVSISEAIAVASMDYPLNIPQKESLRMLLREEIISVLEESGCLNSGPSILDISDEDLEHELNNIQEDSPDIAATLPPATVGFKAKEALVKVRMLSKLRREREAKEKYARIVAAREELRQKSGQTDNTVTNEISLEFLPVAQEQSPSIMDKIIREVIDGKNTRTT